MARLDQAAADRRGYEARCTNDPVALGRRIKELVAQDEYRATGNYNDVRFERHVRAHLRKLAKLTKTNEGFGKMLRYQ